MRKIVSGVGFEPSPQVSAVLEVLLEPSKELEDESTLDDLMAIDGGGEGVGEEVKNVVTLRELSGEERMGHDQRPGVYGTSMNHSHSPF